MFFKSVTVASFSPCLASPIAYIIASNGCAQVVTVYDQVAKSSKCVSVMQTS